MEEEDEEETSKVQVEPIKFISTCNIASTNKGTPNTGDGYTIYESLEGTYQEMSRRRHAVKKFTVGARISAKLLGDREKKFFADANYMPKSHLLSIYQRIRHLEVHANGSPLFHKILRERIRQLENKIFEDTTYTFNVYLQLVVYFEEEVDMLKHHFKAEKSIALLRQALANSNTPAPEKKICGLSDFVGLAF